VTTPWSTYDAVSCRTKLLELSSSMSAVHLDMLESFVFPQIVAEVDGLIFQQDGAPAHSGAIVHTAMDERFPSQLMSRGRPVNWLPWSPDTWTSSVGTSETLCTAEG
jgi:hypothetical protein